MLAHAQFPPTSTPKSLSAGLLSILHPVSILGAAPTPVQDLALGLAEPQEVQVGPLLGLVQVPLNGIPSLRVVTAPLSLVSPADLLGGTLGPTVRVTGDDI